MRRWLTALAAICASSAAGAVEVIDSTFQVEITRDGQTQSSGDLLVPNLPDASCYYWYVKFDPATKTEVTLVETLTLPEPLDAWKNYANDPASATQINANAMSAVTTLKAAPDEGGWVNHGWCVAAGDPNGAHNITVTFNGAEVGNWDFSVVPAEDYAFPGEEPAEEAPADEPAPPSPPSPPPQPSPLARDVNQSW